MIREEDWKREQFELQVEVGVASSFTEKCKMGVLLNPKLNPETCSPKLDNGVLAVSFLFYPDQLKVKITRPVL